MTRGLFLLLFVCSNFGAQKGKEMQLKTIFTTTLAMASLLVATQALAQNTGLINNADINDLNTVDVYSGAGATGNDGESTYAGSGADRTTKFGARNGNQLLNWGEQTTSFDNQSEGVANTNQAWSGDGSTLARGHFNITGEMDQGIELNGNSRDVDGRVRAYGTIESGTDINGQSGGSISFQESSGRFQISAGKKHYGQPAGSDLSFSLNQFASTEGGAQGGGFASARSGITDYATVNGNASTN